MPPTDIPAATESMTEEERALLGEDEHAALNEPSDPPAEPAGGETPDTPGSGQAAATEPEGEDGGAAAAAVAEDGDEPSDDEGETPEHEVARLRQDNARLQGQVDGLKGVRETPPAGSPAEKPPPPPFDFDAAEKQYADLLEEGEVEEAAKLRRTIRTEDRKAIRQDVKGEVFAEMIAARVDAAVAALITEHPELDQDSDAADQALIDEVNAFHAMYINQGVAADVALQKAADQILRYRTPPQQEAETPAAEEGKGNSVTKPKPAGRQPAPGPRALGETPAAGLTKTGGGEFAHLDNIEGEELEREMAKLTPEQEKRYLQLP